MRYESKNAREWNRTTVVQVGAEMVTLDHLLALDREQLRLLSRMLDVASHEAFARQQAEVREAHNSRILMLDAGAKVVINQGRYGGIEGKLVSEPFWYGRGEKRRLYVSVRVKLGSRSKIYQFYGHEVTAASEVTPEQIASWRKHAGVMTTLNRALAGVL